MSNLFCEIFVKLRKEAGFDTPYEFYHRNGGKKVFKLTFSNYLKIEKGGNLPRPERLSLFLALLHIITGSAKAKELMTAYFKTLCGEKFFDLMIAPFISVKPNGISSSPTQKTLKRTLNEQNYYITPKQMKVIAENPQTYWCFNVLTNDTSSWTKEKLAKLLQMDQVKIGKALQVLAKAGIVKTIKNGAFKSPLAGKYCVSPRQSTLPPDILGNIEKYCENMKKSGRRMRFQRSLLRADEMDFRNFSSFLINNHIACRAYRTTEKTDHSALVLVESTIKKLFPF